MPHLTRAWFLTTGGAMLAGCGHAHHDGSVLPGAAPSSSRRSPAATPAQPIPDNVLQNPIVGEAWRFDGASVPAGWIRLDGQTLARADYRQLASVVANGAGRPPSASFTLAQPTPAWIIAVTGVAPTSPRMLASLHRGATTRFGVSVIGLTVREAPLTVAPLALPVEPNVPTWYPGTMATEAQLAEQRHAP